MIKIPAKITAKASHAVVKAVIRTVFRGRFAIGLLYHTEKIFSRRRRIIFRQSGKAAK
jgi:gamma-glutamyl-gamma-aminobutyrate hydrolase PuuD